MTRLFDVTDGRMTEFKRVLSKAGFTSEDVLRIIKTPGLAKRMHDSLTMSPREVAEWLVPPMSWSPPSWWRTPAQQLERADDLWPGIAPRMPKEQFVPRTSTEVPLLHVPRSFNELFDTAQSYVGLIHWWPHRFKSDKQHLRLAPNISDRTEPIWLAFDYAANRDKTPISLWNRPDLAASEVLSALIQFPDWSMSWSDKCPNPYLSGYMVKDYDGCWRVPSLDPYANRIEIGCWARDMADQRWASPTVREL